MDTIIIGVQDYWKRFAGSVLHRRLSWARKAKFSNVAFSNCFGSIAMHWDITPTA